MKLKLSKIALQRFLQRTKQLMEQGDSKSLLPYVERFARYITGGLNYSVTNKGLRKYRRLINPELRSED